MRFLRKTSLAFLLLAVTAGCQPAPAPVSEPAGGGQGAPAQGGERAAALAKWRAAGISSYAYMLEISCFCIHRGVYAVEVRDGNLASVRDARTGTPSPESRVSWIVTVDRLFEAMDQASSLGTPVRAVYDARLGYPTETEIGLLADDSGTLYRITELRAL